MKFIDYKEAIGILVVSGFTVRMEEHGDARQIFADDELVTVPLFRDGTTWKVKEEAVIDWMDDFDREQNEKIEQEPAWEDCQPWTMNF